MSVWWIALITICSALAFSIVVVAIVLFSPLVFIVDSQNREFRLRWLALIEFWTPLPGGGGEAALRLAGRPVRLRPRKQVSTPVPAKPVREKPPSRPPVAFLWRCLRNSRIRHRVAKQLTNLFRRVLGAFRLTECRSAISLPDPAINGILAGVLGRTGWSRAVRVNFTGENSLRCEVRLYPFRVARAALQFVSGMPYRSMLREWRKAKR